MNILYYQHQFPAIGGIESVTATLSNYFVSQGHAVTIVAYLDKRRLGSGLVLDPRVTVLHMPDSDNVTARNTAFLQAAIRDRTIDVIIFQDSYAQIEANLFVEDLRVPVVTCEHNAPYAGVVPVGYYAGLKGRLRRWLRFYLEWRRFLRERRRRQFLYAHSARYVLLSTRFFGEFRTIAGLVDHRKLVAIPDPMPPGMMAGAGGGHDKANEIVFVGSLNYLKGCDLLLEAWKGLSAKHADWRLVIVGDGTERERLESMAQGIPNVAFEGYKDNPQPYFARAKIFAFPSRREGWGLVLLEAMANGCVPVSFNSYASVYDIICEGGCGTVVPAFDVEEYMKALDQLMTQGALSDAPQALDARQVDRFAFSRVGGLWLDLMGRISCEGKQ